MIKATKILHQEEPRIKVNFPYNQAFIKTLLGHESSKTTEIYTHVTTKGFDQIKNPLDGLDI